MVERRGKHLDQNDVERRTPWSPQAERAVLGAMMLDTDSALLAAETVRPEAFWRESHRRIFEAMLVIAEKGMEIDPVLLCKQLESSGNLDTVGGIEFLNELQDVVPTAAHLQYHADILKDDATRRRLIVAGETIVREATDTKMDTAALLDATEHALFEIANREQKGSFESTDQLTRRSLTHVEMLHRKNQEVLGVPTGYKDLDRMTGGFRSSDLVIVAARPSMGKTSLGLNMAQHAAIRCGIGTAIFSFEMGNDQLMERLYAAQGDVNLQRLRQGKLSETEAAGLARAAGEVAAAPIWIDDTSTMTPIELRSKARRLKRRNPGLGLVVVDYLQLMEGGRHHDRQGRNEEVSYISRSLKHLAKELEVPVVAMSQLSRAVEQRGKDFRPRLSDLRDSGSIEQDADVVLFIYREEVYFGVKTQDGRNLEGRAELIVAKQRNGPVGSVNLFFRKNCTRFENRTFSGG